MKRATFLSLRRPSWQRFESMLVRAGASRTPAAPDVLPFSQALRGLCHDLATVRSRGFGRDLEHYLNDLVVRGHNTLYASAPGNSLGIRRFLSTDFPRLLRANAVYFLVSLVLFAAPAVISALVVRHDSSLAGRVLPAQEIDQMERMYREPGPDDRGRLPSAPLGMTGFYTRNNVGIAFRCFATGVFFGLGSAYFLVYNGIVLGTVAGFLVASGHGERFFSFVIGHGAFELTAIVIAGAAGLRLGHAIVHPAPYRWSESLRLRGRMAAQLAQGAAAMLLVAALIEAGWSPLPLPPFVKYAAGATFWLVVFAYLGFAGQQPAPRT